MTPRRPRPLIATAQQIAPLEHPSLERVIDVGTDGPITFVVRDQFIASAEDHLTRRGGAAAGWAVAAVGQIAEGLSWAHDRGVIHGHPRPEVVKFTEEGDAVLTAFGLRAVLRDDSETRSGAAWAHLAPELRQYWEPTTHTDIFAWGPCSTPCWPDGTPPICSTPRRTKGSSRRSRGP